MKDVAHISFDGGGIMIPVHTPYERQLMVEHVEASTNRYGCIRLEVNRQHWTISRNRGSRTVCAACSQWPDNLAYPTGSTGRLSVVSTRAMSCTDRMCTLSPAGGRT